MALGSRRLLVLTRRLGMNCSNALKENERNQIMPLITCVECNQSLSTLAATCPHCGAPVSASVTSPEPVLPKPNPPPPKAPSPPNVNKKVGLKLAGVMFILIGIFLFGIQAAGGIGSTVRHEIVWWPSAILFVVGGLLWKAGR